MSLKQARLFDVRQDGSINLLVLVLTSRRSRLTPLTLLTHVLCPHPSPNFKKEKKKKKGKNFIVLLARCDKDAAGSSNVTLHLIAAVHAAGANVHGAVGELLSVLGKRIIALIFEAQFGKSCSGQRQGCTDISVPRRAKLRS